MSDEKKTELGLSLIGIWCNEDESGFVQVNKEESKSDDDNSEVAFDNGQCEFCCMALDHTPVNLMERLRSKSKLEGDLCEMESDILAGSMNTPENFQKLYDKNVFVFDTGATTTSTGNDEGAENVRYQEGVETVASNGAMTKQLKFFDLPVEKLDKHGKHCNYTELRDVQYSEDNKFNLFAVNKMLDAGWEARGSKEIGWILKKGILRSSLIFVSIHQRVVSGSVTLRGVVEK